MSQAGDKKEKFKYGSQLSRRDFLKIFSVFGATAVLAGWEINRTKWMWRVGESLGLVSLRREIHEANNQEYAGAEVRISFGDHPHQYVMIFPPLNTVPVRNSTVFFVHGGGWQTGNPEVYRFVGRFFAAIGYPTILAGYRMVPEYQFPTQLADVSAGLRAGMNYLIDHDAPVKHIILGGHSAGAQLAALLAYDQTVMEVERRLFFGLVTMSGPLDFSLCRSGEIRDLLDDYLGNLADLEEADPITHADPDVPISVLCLHGAQDPIVDSQNARSFTDKLNQGLIQRAKLHILPNRYHSDMLNLFLETSEETTILTDWLITIDESVQGQIP